jgi:hypothetical protein
MHAVYSIVCLQQQLVSYAAPVVTATKGCVDDAFTNGHSTSDCPRQSNNTVITVIGMNFGPQHAAIMIGGIVAQPVNLNDFGNAGREQTTAMAILPYGSGTQLTVNVIQSGGEVSVGKKLLSYSKCGAGYYNSDLANQGYFDCTPCAAGYTNSQEEAYSCQICSAGYYCSATESMSCSLAVIGSTSVAGAQSTSDCICASNEMAYHNTCIPCSEGLDCSITGLTTSTVSMYEGYWRTSTASIDTRKCSVPKLCTGGVGAGNDLCAVGQSGPYCAVCSYGWSKTLSGACQQCSSNGRSASVTAIPPIIFIVLILAAIAYWAYTKRRATVSANSSRNINQLNITPPASPRTVISDCSPIKTLQLQVDESLETVATSLSGSEATGVRLTVTDVLSFIQLVLTELRKLLHSASNQYSTLSARDKRAVDNLAGLLQHCLVQLQEELQQVNKFILADSVSKSKHEAALSASAAAMQMVVAGIISYDSKLRTVLPFTTASGFSSLYKVAVTFSQIMGAMQSVFLVQFPPTVSTGLGITNFVNLSFLSALPLNCFGGYNFYDELLFKTLAPLAIAILMCLMYLAVKHTPLFRVLQRLTSSTLSKAALSNKIIGAFLVLTYTVLPGVSTSIFRAFPCDNLDDGTTWLRADYSISCKAPQRSAMVLYAAVMVSVQVVLKSSSLYI